MYVYCLLASVFQFRAPIEWDTTPAVLRSHQDGQIREIARQKIATNLIRVS